MKILLNNKSTLCYRATISSYRLATSLTKTDDVSDLYPPIKTEYPNGYWSNDIDVNSAWKINELSHKLLAIPSAKEKLEHLAADDATTLWLLTPISKRFKNLEFHKTITKSKILDSLPTHFKEVDTLSQLKFKKYYKDIFSDIFNYYQKILKNDENDKILNYAIGYLLKSMISRGSISCNHLKNVALDEGVRLEAFWRASGFCNEKSTLGTWDIAKLKNEADAGFLQFQFKHLIDYQVRSELPLPEFIPMNDAECKDFKQILPEFSPQVAGIESIQDRPISISGHWIGTNLQFSLGGIHIFPKEEVANILQVGSEYLDEAEVQFALATLFSSCRAQAANCGFSDFLELTYPITSKCIIIHDNILRLFAYQLNTTQIWNTANPVCNILWKTDSIPIYKTDEKESFEMTDESLQLLLQFVCMAPQKKSVDLQPYLSEDKTKNFNQLNINKKGEEIIEQAPIERFKYPRNSVYFRTFV